MLVSFVALCWILLSGHTPVPARGEALPVTVLVPRSTASTPFFLMADPAWSSGHGTVPVQVEQFVNHPRALAGLFRGEAPLLFTGTSVGWENWLGGGSIVMINTGVWGVSHLVGADPRLDDFSLLAGKRIALPFPGAPLDFQTRYILARTGIDPDEDMRIVYSSFSQTVPLLVRGEVDAAPLPEPLATSVVRGQGLHRLVAYTRAWEEVTGSPRSPQVSLFATRAYASAHAELLRALAAQWEEAIAFTLRHPREAAEVSARFLPFSVEIIQEAVQNTLFDLPSFEENRRLVTRYYRQVKAYIPGQRGALGREFFFFPGGEPRVLPGREHADTGRTLAGNPAVPGAGGTR
ncbi:MAG: ABC transporter substrate-binding protein [Spirochaetota bacterium]